MNRRLLYAILIVVILILIINYAALTHSVIGLQTLSSINLFMILMFTALLFYKWKKFSDFDRQLQAVEPELQEAVYGASLDEDDLEPADEKW
jgi:hypothetical protein